MTRLAARDLAEKVTRHVVAIRHKRYATSILLIALSGCGGGGATPTPLSGPAPIGTLAYVNSECRFDPAASASPTGHQALRIQQADKDPVTVTEVDTVGTPDVAEACAEIGATRFGFEFALAGAFQRMGVSPDGSGVVFEVSDQYSVLKLNPPNPEAQGFFFVRSDGSGLRKLGPPSQVPPWIPLGESALAFLTVPSFTPDGGMIVFADGGVNSAGEESIQIVTLDIATGQRTQLTDLPAGFTCCPSFLDGTTVGFFTRTDPNGLNPNGELVGLSVKTDGSGLKALPAPKVAPGSKIIPTFQITGENTTALVVSLPGQSVNQLPGEPPSQSFFEIFLFDADNLLQLTNFRRVDTVSPLLGVDQQRVFFIASADPMGTNPSENCQVFSVDRTAADLRQVTRFSEGEHSINGCVFSEPPGCAIAFVSQDAEFGTLVFYSSCDPFGTNPNGGQLFAMRPDGTGLRELTNARGFATEPSGAVSVELPAPFSYAVLSSR